MLTWGAYHLADIGGAAGPLAVIIEQAIERSGNKGFEAAVGAIEMVSLLERIDQE